MKPALLVIDVQQGCFQGEQDTVPPLKEACENINSVIDLFRKKDMPVVCIRHMDAKYGMTPGEKTFETVDFLDILPEDLHVNKTYGNAFNKTELADKLIGLGVDTVIPAGYCAEQCVLATCVGATDNDFMPIIIRGTLISHSVEQIKFVEDINDIMTEGIEKGDTIWCPHIYMVARSMLRLNLFVSWIQSSF